MLIYAIQTPKVSLELLQTLIQHGANVNLQNRDDHKDSPLHSALRGNHPNLKIAQFLLKNGANPNLIDAFDRTAGEDTLAYPELVRLCVANGGNFHRIDKRGEGALTKAIRIKSLETVRYLLKQGVDPNAHRGKGQLPLEAVVDVDSLPLFRLLLQFGARLTPLYSRLVSQASAKSSPRILRLLLQSKPRGYKMDSQHLFDALLFSNFYNHGYWVPTKTARQIRDTVEVLLEQGADPNARNAKEETPLFYFVRHVIELETYDRSVLHNYILVADGLLRHGASLFAKNKEGETLQNWTLKQKAFYWHSALHEYE